MGTKTSTTELIQELADNAGASKADAKAALESIFDAIGEHLKNGNAVSISGFGTFKPKHRAARTARNPRTGESIDVAATNTATFTPAKALKDILN